MMHLQIHEHGVAVRKIGIYRCSLKAYVYKLRVFDYNCKSIELDGARQVFRKSICHLNVLLMISPICLSD